MAHARKQIRDAVAAVLTGLPTTGANVYVNRAHLLEAASLPCLSIHLRSDQVDRITQVSIEQRRTVEIVIEAHAQGASVDDTLDTICAEVEAAIGADATIGGTLIDCRLVGTSIDVSGEAARIAGVAAMTYEGVYSVREGAPEVLL